MRVLLPVGLVASVLIAVAGPAAGCGGVALPPGAQTGSVCGDAPPSKCSADGTYFTVTGACCGFANCPMGLMAPAYALCDGTSFSACTCIEPSMSSGWSLINPPKMMDGGTFPDIIVPDTFVPPHDSTVDTGGEGGGDTGLDSPGDSGPVDTGSKDAATSG